MDNAKLLVWCNTITELNNALNWAHDRNRPWSAETAEDGGWIVRIILLDDESGDDELRVKIKGIKNAQTPLPFR